MHRRNSFQPDALPNAGRACVENTLGLRLPILLAARHFQIGGIIPRLQNNDILTGGGQRVGNIGREAAKSGLPPEELHDAIVKLSAKKSLHIRGLMASPPVADEKTKNSNYFTEMRQVFIDILTKKYDNVDMDYLSMGMTNDFETAIACGANMVRVGTAIFGKRPYQIVSP